MHFFLWQRVGNGGELLYFTQLLEHGLQRNITRANRLIGILARFDVFGSCGRKGSAATAAVMLTAEVNALFYWVCMVCGTVIYGDGKLVRGM